MLDHSREAVALLRTCVRADLDSDRTLNLAVARLLEIVGEAASRVSDRTQDRHREIPWPEIIGLRNRIIHGYDTVDFDIVWTVVKSDLPPLIQMLEKTLGL